jgi:hypothetical protein
MPCRNLVLRDAPDARWLAESFSGAFAEAGWGSVPTKPIPDLDPLSEEYRRGESNVTAAGGQASGVTVVSRLSAYDCSEAVKRAISRGMKYAVYGSRGAVPVPEKELRIVIGRKMEPIFFDPEDLATPDGQKK